MKLSGAKSSEDFYERLRNFGGYTADPARSFLQSLQNRATARFENTYKSKLEEALERERKSRTLLSAITDRNWKERAANSARAQATREYQGEGEMDEAVLENINKTRESAYNLLNKSRKSIERTVVARDIMEVMPGGGAGSTLADIARSGVASMRDLYSEATTGQSGGYSDRATMGMRRDRGMTDKAWKEMSTKDRKNFELFQAINRASGALDFMPATGLAKPTFMAPIKLTGKALFKGALTKTIGGGLVGSGIGYGGARLMGADEEQQREAAVRGFKFGAISGFANSPIDIPAGAMKANKPGIKSVSRLGENLDMKPIDDLLPKKISVTGDKSISKVGVSRLDGGKKVAVKNTANIRKLSKLEQAIPDSTLKKASANISKTGDPTTDLNIKSQQAFGNTKLSESVKKSLTTVNEVADASGNKPQKGLNTPVTSSADKIRHTGTKTGKRIANKMNIEDGEAGRLLSNGERIVEELASTDKANLSKIISAVKARDANGLSRSQTKIYDDVVKMLDDRFDEMSGSGISVKKLDKYFPQMLDPAKRDEAIKYLIDNGRKEDATIVEKMFMRSDLTKKASAEMHRSLEGLPEEFYINDDLALLSRWNKETAERVARARVWGPNMESLTNDLAELSKEMKPSKYANIDKFVKETFKTDIYGTVDKYGPGGKVLPVGRQAVVATKMTTSSLKNAAQSSNTAQVGGMFNTAKNIKKYVTKTGRNELKNIALDAGVNVHYLTDQFTERLLSNASKSMGLSKKASEVLLKYNGFQGIEKFNRLVSAGTGKDYITRLAKNPMSKKNARLLRNLKLDPADIAKNGLSKDALNKGIRNFVGETQFYTGTKDVPLWTNRTELGKTVSHLGKFSIKQWEHYRNNIIKEATRGNLAPAFRFLATTTIAGEILTPIYNKITNKKREYTSKEILEQVSDGDLNEVLKMVISRVGENIDMTGGMGYAIEKIQSLDYAPELQDKIASMSGPVLNEVYQYVSLLWALGTSMVAGDSGDIDFNLEKLLTKMIKTVPFGKQMTVAGKKSMGGADKAYQEKFGENALSKALDRTSRGFDPRASKYWDAIYKIYKDYEFKPKRDDVVEAVKVERSNGDIRNTALYKALEKKANSNVVKQKDETVTEYEKRKAERAKTKVKIDKFLADLRK